MSSWFVKGICAKAILARAGEKPQGSEDSALRYRGHRQECLCYLSGVGTGLDW